MARISENGVKKICEICERYANEKTPLMMILSDIQNEFGYIPLDVQKIVSENQLFRLGQEHFAFAIGKNGRCATARTLKLIFRIFSSASLTSYHYKFLSV